MHLWLHKTRPTMEGVFVETPYELCLNSHECLFIGTNRALARSQGKSTHIKQETEEYKALKRTLFWKDACAAALSTMTWLAPPRVAIYSPAPQEDISEIGKVVLHRSQSGHLLGSDSPGMLSYEPRTGTELSVKDLVDSIREDLHACRLICIREITTLLARRDTHPAKIVSGFAYQLSQLIDECRVHDSQTAPIVMTDTVDIGHLLPYVNELYLLPEERVRNDGSYVDTVPFIHRERSIDHTRVGESFGYVYRNDIRQGPEFVLL